MNYGLERVHRELAQVLGDVARVLDENGLPYSVMCGTLLGAVRHGGFIPWDDDVDVVLPRESYDRFEKLYPSQHGEGFLLDLSDTWVPRVRKANGDAFVDLFILDPMPDGRFARFWKLFRLRALQGMLKEHTDYTRFSRGKRILLRGTHWLGRPFSKKAKLAAYRRVSRTGTGANVHMSNGAFGLLTMTFSRDTFSQPATAAFENLTVRVPRDAQGVLAMLYGADYMTPPPESERKPLHLDR